MLDEDAARAEHGAVNEEEAVALAEGAWQQLQQQEREKPVPYEAFTACVETLRGVAHSLVLGGYEVYVLCLWLNECVCVFVFNNKFAAWWVVYVYFYLSVRACV